VGVEGYQLDIEEIAKTHISRLRITPLDAVATASDKPAGN